MYCKMLSHHRMVDLSSFSLLLENTLSIVTWFCHVLCFLFINTVLLSSFIENLRSVAIACIILMSPYSDHFTRKTDYIRYIIAGWEAVGFSGTFHQKKLRKSLSLLLMSFEVKKKKTQIVNTVLFYWSSRGSILVNSVILPTLRISTVTLYFFI